MATETNICERLNSYAETLNALRLGVPLEVSERLQSVTPALAANALSEAAAIISKLVEAGAALIADVRRRYPGEDLRCPYMIALDEALSLARGESPTNPDGPEAHQPSRRQLMTNSAGWMPIETAPKGDDPKETDGPAILIWAEGWETGYEGFWYAYDQCWLFGNLDSEYGSPLYPTHWMPLPNPPEISS